jgi:Family of unknown function (DUF5923)
MQHDITYLQNDIVVDVSVSLPNQPFVRSSNMEFGSPVFHIRFYGSLPPRRMLDNKQIDETLLRYFPVEIDKLSPDGRNLIQDARDFVETARLMVQEKNTD